MNPNAMSQISQTILQQLKPQSPPPQPPAPIQQSLPPSQRLAPLLSRQPSGGPVMPNPEIRRYSILVLNLPDDLNNIGTLHSYFSK